MHTVLLLFLRTVLFYAILMFSLRIMGKRQIGDAEPSDLAVTILISELISTPLQNPDAPVFKSLVPVAVLVVIEIAVALLSLKNLRLRRFFQGRYGILVEDGKINQSELAAAHITVDELLEEIRQNGGLSVDEVRLCVLETSGRMSVILKNGTEPSKLPVTLISDGRVVGRNLKVCRLSEKELSESLSKVGVSEKEVFWTYFSNGEIVTVKKEENQK